MAPELRFRRSSVLTDYTSKKPFLLNYGIANLRHRGYVLIVLSLTFCNVLDKSSQGQHP